MEYHHVYFLQALTASTSGELAKDFVTINRFVDKLIFLLLESSKLPLRIASYRKSVPAWVDYAEQKRVAMQSSRWWDVLACNIKSWQPIQSQPGWNKQYAVWLTFIHPGLTSHLEPDESASSIIPKQHETGVQCLNSLQSSAGFRHCILCMAYWGGGRRKYVWTDNKEWPRSLAEGLIRIRFNIPDFLVSANSDSQTVGAMVKWWKYTRW